MRRLARDLGPITPQLLAEMRHAYQPMGSGPLGVMRQLVSLIEAIAVEKGWDLDEVEWTRVAVVRTEIPGGMQLSNRVIRYRGLSEIKE